MTDLIDSIAEVKSINLDSFAETQNKQLSFPDKSLKQNSAMISLLSQDPTQLTENYQRIIDETKAGQSFTKDSILNSKVNENTIKDKQSIMSILSDPHIPYEQKKAIIDGLNTKEYQQYASEPSTLVAESGFSSPSKGENPEQEDVRIMGSDQFKALRTYQIQKDQLRNKSLASLDPNFQNLAADVAETILPFATNKNASKLYPKIGKELGVDVSATKSALMPGSVLETLIKARDSLPADKRLEVDKKIVDLIKENSGIYLTKNNDFVALTQLQQFFDEGGYSNFDKYVDNTVGVLDIIGIGSSVKSLVRKISSLFKRDVVNVERNINLKQTVNGTNDTAPIKVVKESNPEQARKMYSLIIKSPTDEVAEALTGTSRVDAVASEVMPAIKTVDGSVESKLVDPLREEKVITPDESVANAVNNSGGLYLEKYQVAAAKAKVFNDITNASGLTALDNMTQVGSDGNKLIINAVYGTSEGGFKKAEDAIEQAKFALRDYGIDEQNLTILKKVDDEYVPVSLNEVKGIEGNYLLQLNAEHRINYLDVLDLGSYDVKRNFFDRIPFFRSDRQGSVANHILDNASMLHPIYTGPAVVAIDKATRIDKMLLKLHTEFSDQYKVLGKDRQAKVYDYIKEANHDEIDFDVNDLIGRGFSGKEINTLASWRKAWDTMYYFENSDLVRTLSNNGFKLFDNGNARFVAKEIPKNQNIVRVYDSATDSVINIDKTYQDNLYNAGGTLASLRRPISINGVNVEHMIVHNNTNSYLKGLTDADQILAYKKGYYSVQYKAPKFIVQKVINSDGSTYEKAIAAAGDSKEAEFTRQRLASTRGLSLDDLRVRNDVNDLRVDSDLYWDLQHAEGRITQRHRGQRLEGSNGPVGVKDSKYILDPVEAAIRSSRSLAGRIATRDYLEFSKRRALDQYAEYFPKNAHNQPIWTNDSTKLIPHTSSTESKLADARTTVAYLNYLENGYTNSLDNGFKALVNSMADMMGKGGFNKIERGLLNLGDTPLTGTMKNGVFTSYLALNPFRQLIVQAHQAVRLTSYNPSYILKWGLAKDSQTFIEYSSGLKDITKATPEEKAIVDFIQGSGQLDAVDKHNLVRGTLADMAESQSNVKRVIGKALAVPRKIGFDVGEQTNLLAHLLTVRDKYIQKGFNVTDKAVIDEIYSVSRAISYDMNVAGDMPYNQNMAGLFLQFFQVPHKAFTSVLTNRRIPTGDKLRLALGDILLWGVPGATVIENIYGEDILPKQPEAREAVVFGLESVGLNGLFKTLAGKDSKIDFSSLSPYGIDGFAHLLEAVVSGGTLEFIQNTPAFSLYLKDGSKMREAFGRMFRSFGFIDTQYGQEPEDIKSVLSGVAEMSSGWSNAMKAKAILETGKIQDKKGRVLMEDATYMHAVAKVFGFSSMDEALSYKASEDLNNLQQDKKDEWDTWYNSYVRVISRDQKLSNQEPEYVEKVLGAAKLMYKNDFKALEYINKKLAKDIVDRQETITKRIIDAANIKGAEGHLSNVQNLRMLNDEETTKVLKMFDDMQQEIKNLEKDK